jgi:hypothetical protein
MGQDYSIIRFRIHSVSIAKACSEPGDGMSEGLGIKSNSSITPSIAVVVLYKPFFTGRNDGFFTYLNSV